MKTRFAAIMLILCIITTQTVAFAVNDSQAKELQGVWTCVLADGISTLTFNEDGTASLVVGNATYKCTYSLNGNTLNLTQNGSTITASYTNDTISFVLAGQHLVFTRDAFEPTDLIGTWECGLADSVSTLTINSDGTASMVVGGSTYKVTYTVSGNTINLTQNGSTITGTCDSNTISLTFAGVHMLFTKKTAASPSNATASGDLKASLGETLVLKNCTLTLDHAAVEKTINSYGNRRTEPYSCWEPQDSNSSFVSLYGTFTNTGSTPINIYYIYAVLNVDGQYTYNASITGILDGSDDFYRDTVSPMETVGICFYTEIPTDIAGVSRFSVRLGFTEEFTPRVMLNGLPDFDKCYQTYEVSLPENIGILP